MSRTVYKDLFSPSEWSEFQQNMRKAISFAENFAMRNKTSLKGWDGIHNDTFFDERTIHGHAKRNARGI